MILDNQTLFSDAQAITADCASSNILKFRGDIAYGTPVEILVQIQEDFLTAEVSSIAVKIQTDDNESFSSVKTLQTETLDALTKGARAKCKFLPTGNEGYLRLYYDITFQSGVSAATKGKITACIVDGIAESHQ